MLHALAPPVAPTVAAEAARPGRDPTEAARRHIAAEGFDPVYGARPLRRFIQREVETRIGRALLAGDIPATAPQSPSTPRRPAHRHLDVPRDRPAASSSSPRRSGTASAGVGRPGGEPGPLPRQDGGGAPDASRRTR
nr:hypothetical protein [Streptomyces sp. NRRL B-24572]